jgi:FKBP-type peptidyl-prolyl cis-trans isomerase
MNTPKEKASYCIGLETGKNLKEQFEDIDIDLLAAGFHDAISNSTPKLPAQEIQNVLTAVKHQIDAQQRQYIAKVAHENKLAGEEFLATNKAKPGVKVLPSGLQYKVVNAGTGATPTLLDEVTIHYKGTFIDGRVFDSSYERGKPHVFPVNRVIPGWSEALQMMKVGDKWEVVIPSYLAYGEAGFANQIGPNFTLVFEMELLGINDAKV